MIDDNEDYRFGRAGPVQDDDLDAAGFFTASPQSLLIGYSGKRRIFWNGAGGLLLLAGARSGKLRDVLAYNLCGDFFSYTMLILDMKGELAAISRGCLDRCIYWNPAGLHGLPQDRINPTSYLKKGSPSLVSDTKVYCQNVLPKSGSPTAEFFEARAQSFLEAIILTIVEIDGELTLPRLYEIVNLIPGNSERWLHFAFEMHKGGFEIARSVEEEIAASRENEGGGFRGILGEIMKAVAPLSDPSLMASVSPPFTAHLEDMIAPGSSRLYLMPPAEFAESWSPVIKSLMVGLMIYKARAPQSVPQTWILDECALLGNFPLIARLFSYGAGIGIRPWAVYQSFDQMKATGPGADTIIPASAAVQSHFGIREIGTATRLSRQMGMQTLEYDDDLAQARAKLAQKEAAHTLLSGGDPVQAGLHLAHYGDAAGHRTKQARELMKPDEIMRMPADKQIIFADGLAQPAYVDRGPATEQRSMACRFHPNPYHPPLDRVRVKTRFGHAWKRVIVEPVPPEYAHLPQYANGMWSRIEPLKWWQ